MAVALALGLGTMVGWKRIVVTVGERIGQHDLWSRYVTLVAMTQIAAADGFGMPVSTTRIEFCGSRDHGGEQFWSELCNSKNHSFGLDLYLASNNLFIRWFVLVVPTVCLI